MAKHAIVRLDVMLANNAMSAVKSAMYYSAYTDATTNTPAAIDNANIVELKDILIDGDRELWVATTPTASSTRLALVTTPEVDYDERLTIFDFENKANKPIRVHLLSEHVGQIFSATAEAFNTTPTVGDVVEAQAGTKMKVVANATNGSTTIGKIVGIEDVNGTTFYVVRVE
jgi:hypothetical protein